MVHVEPRVHTRRQRLSTHAPERQSGVDEQVPPIDTLPSGAQSVTSVARDVLSTRHDSPKSQPVLAATGLHGREQSP